MDGAPVSHGAPSVTLQFADGAYSGYDGCNGVWGEYQAAAGRLRTTNRNETTKACLYPDASRQAVIGVLRKLLDDGTAYAVDGRTLRLRSSSGRTAVFSPSRRPKGARR